MCRFNFGIFVILLVHSSITEADIVNKNVERIVDIASQLVKITTTITFENTGTEKESTYLLALDPDTHQNLSYIGAKDALKANLKCTEVKLAKYPDKNFFSIELANPVLAGRAAVITVDLVFTGLVIPHPNAITQKEDQRVYYKGNHYFYSPYTTVKQVTSVIINTRNVESYTKLNPVTQTDTTLTYGPYNNVAAFSLDPLMVHYKNNSPFLTVTHLERTLDVSHWGGISVQENIDILHSGAKLKGSFSRYQYQRERDTGHTHASVKSYKTILPASAHSIYYRDTNGNISTSQVRVRSDRIELELRPRYPLFGGWQTSYTLGYDVPSHQYLQKGTNNQYLLRMRILDNVFDDMHVVELETNIILPVGVTDVKLKTPYDVERLPDDVTYKYLDTKGRPIIRLRKQNLVEHHIQDFEITYTWNSSYLLHEPVLISVSFYLMFLVVIVYVRLDFSITSPEEHSKTS